MTPRAFQLIQNVLVTAVAVVLALAVWAAFQRVIEPPDPDVVAANEAARSTAAPAVEFPGAPPGTGVTAAPPQGASATATTQAVATCREPAPATGSGTVVRVFYTCGTSGVPTADSFVYREVPETDLVLTATLTELVKGPEPNEAELGFVSFFSAATVDALADVSLNSGRATVELRGLEEIENISTSTGGQFFVANLNANVFQFDTIDAVEYRLNGSCDAFWALVEAQCQLVTRAEWERQLEAWRSEG
jgi:hypothetical protein